MDKEQAKTIAIALGTVLIMGLVGRVEYMEQQEIMRLKKQLTAQEKQIAAFFVKKGVEDPVNKAVKIAQNSKYPKTAAAQAVVESRVKPKAVGRKGEKGAFQVQEKHWGRVADQLELQTKQHSDILADLLWENHNDLRKAIKAYNGTGKQADGYTRLVLRNLKEIER